MTLLRRVEVVEDEMVEVCRAKSGMEQLKLAHEAWELPRERLTAFLGAKHPEWSGEEVLREVARRLAVPSPGGGSVMGNTPARRVR